MALEPITREEMFLAKAGGQEVTTPKPITRIERFLQAIIDRLSGGGGGSSDGGAVQSVNGKTGAVELAYEDLKDKPFYESGLVEVELVPLGEFFPEDIFTKTTVFFLGESIELVDGDDYEVNFNGKTYRDIGKFYSDSQGDAMYIGDYGLGFGGDIGDEFPFCIILDLRKNPPIMGCIALTEAIPNITTETPVQIGITHIEGYIKKIDEKFIPESIARVSDIPDIPECNVVLIETSPGPEHSIVFPSDWYERTEEAISQGKIVYVGGYKFKKWEWDAEGNKLAQLVKVGFDSTENSIVVTEILLGPGGAVVYPTEYGYGLLPEADRYNDGRNEGSFLRVVDGSWAAVQLTDVSQEGA